MALRVSVDAVDQVENVVTSPPLDTVRGTPAYRLPIEPQVGEASFTLLAGEATYAARITVQQGAGLAHVFDGSVVDAQEVDAQVVRTTRVRARDALRRLTTPGITVPLMRDVSVSAAVTALLTAAGFKPAEYRVGASTRMLAYFWLEADDGALDVLQRLCTTDGPRARCYIDGKGLVTFDPDSARETAARSTAVQQAIDVVAARQRRLPGARDVRVDYEAPEPSSATVGVRVIGSGRPPGLTLAFSPSPSAGDRVFIATTGWAGGSVRRGDNAGPFVPQVPLPASAAPTATRLYDDWVWRDGDPESAYVFRGELAVALALSSGGAPPSRVAYVSRRSPGSGFSANPDPRLPAMQGKRGDLAVLIVRVNRASGSNSFDIPDGWTLARSQGYRVGNDSRISRVAYFEITDEAWNANAYVLKNTVTGGSAVDVDLVLYRARESSTVPDLLLAANETREIPVSVSGIVGDKPAVIATVSAGSADLSVTVESVTTLRLKAVAGAQGATVRNIVIAYDPPTTFTRDSKTADADASAERSFALSAWPYVTGPVAQMIADDWADYLDQPFRAVEYDVLCSGDAEITAARAREIGDRVRVTNTAVGLDVTGYIESVRQRILHASLSRFTFSVLEVHSDLHRRDRVLFASGDGILMADGSRLVFANASA